MSIFDDFCKFSLNKTEKESNREISRAALFKRLNRNIKLCGLISKHKLLAIGNEKAFSRKAKLEQ